ncbi:hypothetical protein OIU79_023222, partial [Salix purpurea]
MHIQNTQSVPIFLPLQLSCPHRQD